MKYGSRCLLVVAVLALSGCFVDERTCTPENCNGCCDANGACQVGSAQNACGSQGNLCDVCVTPQTCNLGRCAAGGTGGGVGGGGGGSLPANKLCNTSGLASGCQASAAFSCEASTQCYPTLDVCRSAVECENRTTGTGGGGGGTATGGGGGGTSTGGGGGGTPTGGGGGTTGTNTVSGRATYDFVPARYTAGQGGTLFFNQAQQRPIRNATIRVVQNGSTVIGSAVTGEDGRYTIGFTPGTGPMQVQVLARSQNPSIQVEDNTANNATWAFGATLNAGQTTLDLNATHGWTGTSYGANRRAAPFAILDSMYTASKAFQAVRTVNFPALKVNWSPNNAPQSGNKAAGQISTSHFSPSENEIYVLGLSGADTDEFDTHVIVHEWGHYFEDNLSRSDSPGGPHGRGDVLDPRIAFGEAWGTAVAAMVLPETMYTDTLWGSGQLGAWGYDAETPASGDDPAPNAFSENSVLRVIYDLYDSTADGAHDQVGVGLGAVYDVMSGHQRQTDALTTLASFITGLKALPGANANGINAVAAQYAVGPVTSDFGTGDMNLAGMFTSAPIPYNGGINLLGGFEENTYQQNQYYVFTGTGGTATITANSAQDVSITAYRRGSYLNRSDRTTSGQESFSISTTANATYVVVLTGYAQTMGSYNVSLTITSP